MLFDTFVGLPLNQSIAGATWDSGGLAWPGASGVFLAGDGNDWVKVTQVAPNQGVANWIAPTGAIGAAVFFKALAGRNTTSPIINVFIDGDGGQDIYTPGQSVRAYVGAYNVLKLRDVAAGAESPDVACPIVDGTEYCLELFKTTNANGREYTAKVYNVSGGARGSLLATSTYTIAAALPATNKRVHFSIPDANDPYFLARRFETVDAPVADTIAPNLSNPTVGAIGTTTVNAIVSTDEGGGTMYALVLPSASAVPDVSTIRASGVAQAVTATGTRTIPITALAQATAYRAHFVQVDGAATPNTSGVASSAPFTTLSVDSQAPTFSAGAVITPGAVTSSSVTATGPTATDNVAVVGYQKRVNGGAWIDNGTGTGINVQGLPANTDVLIGWRAVDGQLNYSAEITATMHTAAAPASAAGTITWPHPIAPVNGDARLSAGHRIAVCNMTTDALVVRKTGLVTHATTGVPPAVSDALIVSGTQYRCHLILDSDNAASGTEVITAT